MKENKGITLVALVITIIILLILAVIAIATLGGENGLFAKVKMAKKAHLEAEMKEQLTLALNDLQLEKKGEATLDDVTQEWIEKEINEYSPNLKEDASVEGKLAIMIKNNITGKFLIDANLNIIDVEYNSDSLEFEYEVKSRNGDNIEILIKARDNVNGIKQIDYPDGRNKLVSNNKKDYIAIDYTVELGKEYKFIITTGDDNKVEKTVKIDNYYYSITKTLGDNAKIDNNEIKAAYNKEYNATVIADGDYILTGLTVTMGGETITTSDDNVVDISTGKIKIANVTGNIDIIAITKKLEIQVTEPYIGESKTETDASLSVKDKSQNKGTVLYINFKATLEGTDCSVKAKDDDTKTLPYEITYDGTYTFVATGIYANKTVTKEITVNVEKYKIYKIYTAQDLQDMSKDNLGDYIIMNDIDMSDFDFKPINYGTGKYFEGTLDGQGHTISNLTINNTTSDQYTGMFTTSMNATFKNMLLKNVEIYSDYENTGTLVGKVIKDSITIEKVGITGNISGKRNVGSFIGDSSANGQDKIEFINCYAITNVISKLYSAGGFSGGGISNIKVTNCYWSGTINTKSWVGTFKPSSSSNGQHLYNKPEITDCFYNKELFSASSKDKYTGTGLTTAQFAIRSSFASSWDFKEDENDTEYTWYIDKKTGYPELHF